MKIRKFDRDLRNIIITKQEKIQATNFRENIIRDNIPVKRDF